MNTTTTTNQGWEAFAKAARELDHGLKRPGGQDVAPLMDEVIACVRPIAADDIDAANVASDLFALHAFIARSRLALQKAEAAPAPPAFTSQFARGVARRLRMLFVSISESMTEAEVRQLAALLAKLDHTESKSADGPECVNGKAISWDFIWDLLAMHPADATFWIRTFLRAENGVAS